ncbi:MAG: fatty acid--CoA ligase, partial [Actinomycetota bacterium]
MQSTMQDFPLTIGMIFRHGRRVYANSEVVTFEGETSRRATFAQVAERAEKLAAALQRLGIQPGD